MTNGSKKHAVIKLIALTKPNHDKKEYFANDTPDINWSYTNRIGVSEAV